MDSLSQSNWRGSVIKYTCIAFSCDFSHPEQNACRIGAIQIVCWFERPKFGARAAQVIVSFTDPFEHILIKVYTNEINLAKFFEVLTSNSREITSVKVDKVHTEDIGVDKINNDELDVVEINAGDFGVNFVNACDVDGKVFVTE
ncbi:hypothetical protein BOTNAR_0168g00020 [Botryotinia narcissicola]|uniref:Uncharacterized protein n=1 Tax=Botryotinia narcissicola TaxID=278944 RepID=A0A4Z1ICA2_9HELO|nr:hypothetical protein BOTNAR_0168g00020 [Botryotinia narcissicola]